MSKFQVLEVSDSQDFCMCCGRKGLKRVVFILNTETDEVKHFGTTCAAQPVKGFGVDKEIKEAIRSFADKEKMINVTTHFEYRKSGGKYSPNGNGYSSATDKGLFLKIREDVKIRMNKGVV